MILVASLLLTLVVGQVDAQTPPAAREYQGQELTIKVEPARLKLCEGDSGRIVVTVQKVGVYQDVEERWYVPRPRPYRLVNNRWGRQLPKFVSNTPDPSVVWFDHSLVDEDLSGGLWSVYLVTGKKKGSTTIEFHAELGWLKSRDVSVDIEVVECDYEVHTFSIWHLDTTGWNTVVGSSIRTVIVRQPQAPGVDEVDLENLSVIAENTAVEFPAFDCVSSITESTMRAEVRGSLSLRSLQLTIFIDYPDSISASKFVTCTSKRIPAGSDGSGRLDPIAFVFGPHGGRREAPHILRAPGLGDFSGMTYIWVTPIHR